MKKHLHTQTEQTTDVNFNDGYLVISCPDAEEPVLWRMKIGNVNETMITVKANGKNFNINIQTENEKPKKIAIFKTKEQAISLMDKINNSLNNKKSTSCQNNSTKDNKQTAKTKKNYKSDIIMAVIGTILIFIFIWLIQSPADNNLILSQETTKTGSDIGEAISADDFLKSR